MRTVEAGYRLVNPRLKEWSYAAGGGCRVPSLRHRHTGSHPQRVERRGLSGTGKIASIIPAQLNELRPEQRTAAVPQAGSGDP
jgi:hypothetical protein